MVVMTFLISLDTSLAFKGLKIDYKELEDLFAQKVFEKKKKGLNIGEFSDIRRKGRS